MSFDLACCLCTSLSSVLVDSTIPVNVDTVGLIANLRFSAYSSRLAVSVFIRGLTDGLRRLWRPYVPGFALMRL